MRNLQQLTLETIAQIDGERIKIAFEQELKRVISDCYDRPGEKKDRTVSLNLNVSPVLDANGLCEDAKVHFLVTSNVPKRKSKSYSMSLSKGERLLFHDESLDDHRQEALDFGDSDE